MIKSLKEAVLFTGGCFLICYLILQRIVREEPKNGSEDVNLTLSVRNKLDVGRGTGAQGKQVPSLIKESCPRSIRSAVSKVMFSTVTQKSFLVTSAYAR